MVFASSLSHAGAGLRLTTKARAAFLASMERQQRCQGLRWLLKAPRWAPFHQRSMVVNL